MGTLNLRLPDDLDNRLTKLAKAEDKSRSDLARAALEKFLLDMEREKFLAEMVKAARFLATNPEARAESMAISEDFAFTDNEALDIAEGRKPGDPEPEPWWK